MWTAPGRFGVGRTLFCQPNFGALACEARRLSGGRRAARDAELGPSARRAASRPFGTSTSRTLRSSNHGAFIEKVLTDLRLLRRFLGAFLEQRHSAFWRSPRDLHVTLGSYRETVNLPITDRFGVPWTQPDIPAKQEATWRP